MADKELLRQLQECFNECKPAFIAMGDEVRLTIINVLATKALTGHAPGASSEDARLVSSDPAVPGIPDSSDSPAVSDDLAAAIKKGMSVKEIPNMTKLSRPAISHHLKILKKAGLVDSVQAGTSNIYYITFSATTDLLHQLTSILYKLKGKNE